MRPATRTRAVALATLVAAAIGCRPAPEPAPATHDVRYRLAWSWGRAIRDAAGPAWEVVTDRRYTVRLERGYLVSYSMELVACPDEAARARPRTRSWVLFGAAPAHAVHPSRGVGGTAAPGPHIESLTPPAPSDVATVALGPARFCQGHYLIARATRDTFGQPADVDMLGASLYVEGSYREPQGRAAVPFAFRTTVAHGTVTELVAAGVPRDPSGAALDTGTRGALVIVRRTLGTMFDGIAFTTMDEAAIMRRILENLVDGVTIELHPAEPGTA